MNLASGATVLAFAGYRTRKFDRLLVHRHQLGHECLVLTARGGLEDPL